MPETVYGPGLPDSRDIILVEDDLAYRNGLIMQLELAGWNVRFVTNSLREYKTFLRLVRDQSPENRPHFWAAILDNEVKEGD
jgi:DNA-binding response OmpR family regulator